MSAHSITSTGRLIKRGLGWLVIVGVLMLVLCGLATVLILNRGSESAVHAVHSAMATLRPFVLATQVGAIALLSWFWAPLVRRAKFAPAVEHAWLMARHRLGLWALGLTVLGGALWLPR